MTATTRRRLRDSVLALPVEDREGHLSALAGLLHLLEHCAEGREPRGFVAGRRAYGLPVLRWAAACLGQSWTPCPALDCRDPDHVTLLSGAVALPARGARC
jgi:hypothetical protein